MPTAPLQVCSTPGCTTLVPRGSCPPHARTSTRNHRGVSRQARGYDRAYELGRAALLGQPCALRLPGCTGIGQSADHYAGGLRPACYHCQYADGAARGRRVKSLPMGVSARTARQPLFRPYDVGNR